MRHSRLHHILLVGALLAYLVLALPLPAVLLDHEIGLLTGDPSHTINDDHAWLDHAAGSGIMSCDTSAQFVDLVAPFVEALDPYHESLGIHAPSVRGPPVCLS